MIIMPLENNGMYGKDLRPITQMYGKITRTYDGYYGIDGKYHERQEQTGGIDVEGLLPETRECIAELWNFAIRPLPQSKSMTPTTSEDTSIPYSARLLENIREQKANILRLFTRLMNLYQELEISQTQLYALSELEQRIPILLPEYKFKGSPSHDRPTNKDELQLLTEYRGATTFHRN